MTIRWLVVSILLVGGPVTAAHQAAPAAGEQQPVAEGAAATLHAIFDEAWEWTLKEFPTMATYVGDRRYDDRLPDMSLEAIERRKAHTRTLRDRLRTVDRAKLSAGDQLNYDLFLRDLELQIEGERFPSDLIVITQMGGIHQEMAQLAQIVPKFTVRDYENFSARLRQLPALVDQNIVLMRQGLAKGITPPRMTLREVAAAIQQQAVADPQQSPIYHLVFAQVPETIPAAERERLQQETARVLEEAVLPAYRKLHAFFVEEYYPGTRDAIALSSLPDGREWYAYQIKSMTTTDLTAEQIHEIGLSEVARIRADMERIKEQVGFRGGLAEFFTFLRTDPQFYFTEKEALLTTYRDIAKRIDPELPKLFGKLPRLPYGVAPVPEYSEKTQTTAYYNPGSLEAGRAGYFFANTYDLKSRPRWEMEALTIHEAVPGHHLQLALAQELENVPNFRRWGGYTAFIEGWGLYSESLGPELGMYTDPYAQFGQLTYEMWRAIRLVVDTGMHAKGWSRDRAIDYFKENASKTEHDIVVEIDRYIVWPGQALAYKIGELKIKELRASATRELGDRFDIRGFHDAVLEAGALPLDVLESRVKAWVVSQK
jgi:uncharacterized protein (DUF885 family)